MKLRFLFSLMLGSALAAGAQGYHDGVDNYNADRFDIAKEILNNTLNDAGTDKAVSYYYLGSIAFRDKEYTAAKDYFQKGYEANPSYPYNIIGLGQMALKDGNKSEASKYFDQALKTDKKNTALMAAIARAYWNVNPIAATDPSQYDKDVKKWIDKAMKESKNTESAVYMLQGDMAADANPGVAAGFYETAINFDKEKGVVNREAYVKYAHVYDIHNRPLVIEKLEELNELEPNSGLAQRELAEVYYNNEQYDNAWHSYAKYVQNPNHFRRDEQRYSALLYAARQYEEAIQWAEKVLKQDPSIHYMDRIIMLSEHGLERDSLAAIAGRRLFAAPDADLSVNDYTTYGTVLMTAKPEEAVVVLQQGVEKFGDTDKGKILMPLLSKAYRNVGNNEKAIEVQQAYLDSGAASADDYLNMASSYFSKGREDEPGSEQAKSDYANALKYIDLAISKSPNFYYYYYQKGIIAYYANDRKADKTSADALLTMLDKLSANSPEYQESAKPYTKGAYAILGNYYKAAGDDAKASEYEAKLKALDEQNQQ